MTRQQEIDIVKNGIRKYSPVVAEFFDREDKLADYAKQLYDFEVDEQHLQRQKKMKNAIVELSEQIFGERIEPEIPMATNIVDHQAIMNHPILLATNIVANAHRILSDGNKPIIVLTSSIVPLNNFFNKKGFQLHDKKVSLFSNKEIHQASCFVPVYDLRIVERLKEIGTWNDFDQKEKEFLEKTDSQISNLDFSRCQSYNDQISIINKFLWKQMYSEEIRVNVPELYYITEEDLLWHMLPDILQEENIISKSILDKEFRNVVLHAFDGIKGTWDVKEGLGTHFFWYHSENNKAERLFVENDELVSENNSVTIELTEGNLIKNLKDKTIVPSMFTIYSYLVFWCGIKPLVGHGSSNYLTKMKEVWIKVLTQDYQAEAERMKQIDTKGLIGGSLVAYKRNSGKLENQYAFDIIYDGGLTKKYLENLSEMKFKDLLGPALLEIYESYVPVEERQKLSLTPQDMMGKSFDWIK